jgi:hypothetical protein
MIDKRFATSSALWRAAIGTLGGLVLACAFAAAAGALAMQAGAMRRADALSSAAMFALLLWPATLLLAFSVRSAARAALCVIGAALPCAVLGWWLWRW